MVIPKRLVQATLLIIALLPALAQAAAVARVDRQVVEQNESFTLEIIVDTDIDTEPDVTPLEQDFFIGQSSQLSNTTIVNNQITRTRTWSYLLMARRAGRIELPSLTVGSERTEPITITVNEPRNLPPGEADVFITSEVDVAETWVQAQVLYRIKVYRAVATRQPALREPNYEGVEVLVELAGDERSYEAILNGRPYNVVERVYALFPQESGEIRISPARFEARVLRNGRITGRKVFESEPQVVSVSPIPDRPAGFETAAWLPARDLALTEDWSRDLDDLKAGEPISRDVTISVLGQLETQIPVLEPPETSGVNVYPDKPDLSRRLETEGIRGVRRDQYAIIASAAGVVTLPELELPWFDVATAEWRVATLPPRSFDVASSGEPPPPAPVAALDADADTPEAVPAGNAEQSVFWRRASEILAALWVVTLLAWWWSSRPPQRPREPEAPPLHKQQAKHLKAARKAAISGDAQGVRDAMREWALLEWPVNAPRSIGALAERVSSPLSDELARLSNASYGVAGGEWDGESLARALRSFAVIDGKRARDGGDPLPPLMPAG